MKFLISMFLFASVGHAGYLDRDCAKANLSVPLQIKDRFVSQKLIFAKEGDIVCFQISNETLNAVSFSLEGMALADSLKTGLSRKYSLKFPKIGEYAFKIRGTAISEMPKVIVLDKTAYENQEREESLKNSIRNRH